ncbi:glycoprotein-N-acetylgalactosamine 3-beta-galactosyltransferase 1-like [Drosophila sulfurigaster albostrigata]|uniref:glycoprotein-N-acetylgalactosamine 3-beta-galactosyltransferase 1-like n=1 Tax=Drosophila sulfurigaster albostrigata TaxID=89887 RepID=UPI002D21DBEB|nr:glycoprotein-N-acetylgalactosamine 3-beta-galactosyltransferase 1-like [Drosophila sulfurigaster albostrigata]
MVTQYLRSHVSYSRKRSFLTLMSGLIIGFCLGQIISYVTISESIKSISIQVDKNSQSDIKQLAPSINTFPEIIHDHPYDNSTVADQLKKEVRLLCWVMTNPKNHKEKARHVKRTWGKRCNILLFMSSAQDDELPTVKLDVGEGRENLWRKVKEAFKYVYKHHYNDADWFYKADDDTYAIIENLRLMLYPYNPMTPVHFGYKFKPFVKQGYMSGGSGYALSKEALRRFVVEGIPDPKKCLPGTVVNEDIEIGKCMENLNVTAGDSRDWNGRGRMFPFIPEHHLITKVDMSWWYWQYQFYKTDEGLDCCSDNAIAFHYVSPKMMYVMDYLIYHLKPYGIVREPHRLPAKLKVGEFLPPPIEEIVNSNEDSMDDDDKLIKTTTIKSTPAEPDSREVDSKEVDSLTAKLQKPVNKKKESKTAKAIEAEKKKINKH